MIDIETAADGGNEGAQVALVLADDQVIAAQGAFHDAGADDVLGAGAAGESAGGPGPDLIQALHLSSGQQLGKLRLAR